MTWQIEHVDEDARGWLHVARSYDLGVRAAFIAAGSGFVTCSDLHTRVVETRESGT